MVDIQRKLDGFRMDHTSINSFNSKRNLKLPPIQGAVPADIYEDKRWNSNNNNKSISHHHQHHTRIKKDLLGATNFRSLHQVDLNASVDFPRHKAVIKSPRQHVPVQINLGHEFPKTYTVLPPINNKKTTVSQPRRPVSIKRNEKPSEITIQKEESPVNDVQSEPNLPIQSSAARTAAELSARRRERLKERLKAAEESKENISNAEQIKKVDETTINTTSDNCEQPKTEREESVPRKRSPMFLGYLKCKRYARRNGVCPDNEPTLMNVTDQLKEIFLRRNMEEMYLI